MSPVTAIYPHQIFALYMSLFVCRCEAFKHFGKLSWWNQNLWLWSQWAVDRLHGKFLCWYPILYGGELMHPSLMVIIYVSIQLMHLHLFLMVIIHVSIQLMHLHPSLMVIIHVSIQLMHFASFSDGDNSCFHSVDAFAFISDSNHSYFQLVDAVAWKRELWMLLTML